MRIGKFSFEGKSVLAPMAEITNLPFRVICRRYGASLVFTEMVNANALARNNKAALRITRTCDEERPVAVQIFGAKLGFIAKAAEKISDKADIIDINLGCPAKNILRQGAGAALLKRPLRIKEIVSSLSSRGITVTAKVRKAERMEEVLKAIEDGGASAVTVHGRTVPQGYSGKADWDVIKKAKEIVSIPVIGNGDVFDAVGAKRMVDYTGCDFVMIGRGAIGDPHIFTRVNRFLDSGEAVEPLDFEGKKALFVEYLGICERYGYDYFNDIKRKAQEFTKGVKHSSLLRDKIGRSKSMEELLKIVGVVR